jgi:hypothetical protein
VVFHNAGFPEEVAMIARTLALAVGIVVATITSQLPEFAQQYRQRLGGAIDELRTVVARFDQDAGAVGLSREQALQRLQSGPDDFIRRRGESELKVMERLERLEQHRDRLAYAGPFMRVASFLRYGDADLANRTLSDFEPAVPVTSEGVLSAAAGFVAGYGLVRALTQPFRRRRPLLRRM